LRPETRDLRLETWDVRPLGLEPLDAGTLYCPA
jgi:hypothetical protein